MISNQRIPKVNVLGVGISTINLGMALEIINRWIKNQERKYICVTNAHGILECQRDKNLQMIFNDSGLTTPDGMSLVWILNFLGYRNVSRVYGPDLMEGVCQSSSENGNIRHFLYGGTEGVPEKLSKSLSKKYPNINFIGSYSPPFRPLTPDEDEEIIREINELSPDIIWVGLSTPKQEQWMSTHVNRLNAKVLIGVGAAFDFLSGTKKQAPKWIQRSGFEWLFRLLLEPKRLWRRYVKYPQFIILLISQLFGFKDFPMD